MSPSKVFKIPIFEKYSKSEVLLLPIEKLWVTYFLTKNVAGLCWGAFQCYGADKCCCLLFDFRRRNLAVLQCAWLTFVIQTGTLMSSISSLSVNCRHKLFRNIGGGKVYSRVGMSSERARMISTSICRLNHYRTTLFITSLIHEELKFFL